MSDTNSQKIISKIYDHFRASGCRFSTDSREVFSSCGGVFFALSGERFDGNNFAGAAIDNGATLVVVDRADVVPVGAAMLDHRFCSSSHNSACYALVDDVLGAMQQVARMYRREFDAGLGRNMPVIGLTGTNGKTTTKELLVRVLGTKYRVGATVGNLNNHIGVPTTLLSMPIGGGAVCDGCSTDVSQVEVCVVEMGANHVGEIAELCSIAEPNIGLVTNVGCAHIEGFGSEQGVRQAKGELYDYLFRTGGRVVFRADDAVLGEMVEAAGSSALAPIDISTPVSTTVSSGGYCAASLGIGRVWSDDHGFLVFEHQGNTVSTHLVGEYNIYNVMAAMALGQQLGVETAVAVTAVAGYVPENNRSQRIDGARGNVIFMDAYNANPSSMELALENFGRLSISGVSGGASISGGVLGGGTGASDASVSRDKVLILGDMRELGTASLGAHRRILEQAMRLDVGRVFVVGGEMRGAVAASDFSFSSPSSSVVSAAVASASKDRLFVFDDVEQLCRFLDKNPLCSSTILVKGSRGVGLEKVMAWL